MSETAFSTAGLWSYAIALAGFTALALRLALGSRGRRAWLLFAAVALTAVWAAAGFAFSYRPGFDTWLAYLLADALRYAGWFLFIGSLLRGGEVKGTGSRLPTLAVGLVAVVLVATLVLPFDLAPFFWRENAPGRTALYGLHLLLTVAGLFLVEQIGRSTEGGARWSVKPLVVALVGLFAFDLYFYADAMLFGRLDADIWAARGVANAILIPLFVVAAARNPAWTVEMHVSRGAVFHSTAVVLSGIFLLVVAAGGYLVRLFGGEWGRALQVGFLFAALLVGAVVVSSGKFRSRLRVFVSKHFFSYRYDYREEWLRFTGTLSKESSLRGVQEQVIRGLADLVESPGGVLCLREDEGPFRLATRWNMAAPDASTPVDHPLPQFLHRTGWVVDLREFASHADRYDGLSLPDWLAGMPNAWIVVPLATSADLVGFVVLHTPRASVDLNWEVRDLLKVASRQAASYLGHTRATEALLEARKFEAFNRMSAFVVHDLKNLVAQLNLMLKNAERHRDNPEFQKDMLQTVEHVAGRMNGLMQQLRMGVTPAEKKRAVDLGTLLARACRARTADPGRVTVDVEPGLSALAHEDRLDHVVGHLVQNALDATQGGGTVSVRARRVGAQALIEVADTGTGMTPEFVRDRLFKPFETSKKSGMGIGVYESSQYLSAVGGELTVESAPNVGTTFRALLPAGDNSVLARPETVG